MLEEYRHIHAHGSAGGGVPDLGQGTPSSYKLPGNEKKGPGIGLP